MDKHKLALILIGTLTWSLTMVKSGFLYPFGMGFWGPNGHDGIWHISLIESLSRGSWQMPTFAGESLKNYHIGFDLLVAILHRLTGVGVVSLYFQAVPPILALLIGVLTYKFVYLWTHSLKASFWSTFFVYFGGSWGWVITFLRGEGLGGESMFWSQQAISTLINPPFALSLVFILAGLIFLIKFRRSGKILNFILSVLFFGTLIQIKAYAGILTIIGLFVVSFFEIVKEKKFRTLSIALSSLIISVLLILPLDRTSGSLLIFVPFWFLETMMGLTDRLGWLRFYSAMTNYRAGGVWVKAIPAYLIAFAIFWVGNMGTRMTKEFLVFKWVRNWKGVGLIEVFIMTVILAGVSIPMLFLQKGTPWNTIQFFYYSLFFSSILAGIAFSSVLEKTKATPNRFIKVGLIILLTIPTTIGTLGQYLPGRPPSMISNEEIHALSFLSKEPYGVVLTFPFDRAKAKEAEPFPPRPLYLYESTAYVSAFSDKPTFLEDEVNLDITGYDWKGRRAEVENFYKNPNQKQAQEFLKNSKISYVYWLKGQRAFLGEGQLGLKKIFENKEVNIYKVE